MSSSLPADIAHLLKRTSFVPSLDRIQQLAALSWDEALNLLVDQAAAPEIAANIRFDNVYLKSDEDDFNRLLDFELKRLAGAPSGLGDRMLWFWHGVLTSAQSKVDIPPLLLRQHQLLAKHTLGSFRNMLVEITTDPAMLVYLDGDGSTGDAPNENFGRELMELFTLGRGHYQQSDVQAAARGLSGWNVDGFPESEGNSFDPDKIQPRFDPSSAFGAPDTFLGVTRTFDVPSIVETILGQDACARFIAKKVFEYFVHPNPDNDTVSSLAAVFRNGDYQIRALLSAVFRHPDFTRRISRTARARFPLELLLAAASTFSVPIDAFDYPAYFDATGQTPFDPPNVAGWPLGNRWVSPSHSLARARLGLVAYDLPSDNPAIRAVTASDNPVGAALSRAALLEVSRETHDALADAAKGTDDPETRARTLLSLAIASPEFALT